MKFKGLNLNYAKVNFDSKKIEYPISGEIEEEDTGIMMEFNNEKYDVIGFSFGFTMYNDPVISVRVDPKSQPTDEYLREMLESTKGKIRIDEPELKVYGFFDEELNKKSIEDTLIRKSLYILKEEIEKEKHKDE